MSPNSMLYTPIELLRSAPADDVEAACAARQERRTLRVAAGLLVVVVMLVLGSVALAWAGGGPAPCAGKACTARA